MPPTPEQSYLLVEEATFPRDIDITLPEDCSSTVLFAGYPDGYLTEILGEFIKRGGTMVCMTTEESVLSERHTYSEENPERLAKTINSLINANSVGCVSFKVEQAELYFFRAPGIRNPTV